MKTLSKRILREIDSHQLSIVSHRMNKHLVLAVANRIGDTRIIVLARTPSDRRSERNAIAQVRKTAITLA